MVSFIAGQGSTTQGISRIIQMLSAPNQKYAAERVLEELSTKPIKVGSEATRGTLTNFPHLRSVMLEAAR